MWKLLLDSDIIQSGTHEPLSSCISSTNSLLRDCLFMHIVPADENIISNTIENILTVVTLVMKIDLFLSSFLQSNLKLYYNNMQS